MKIFPGLGFHEGYPLEVQMSLLVPERELETVSVKIIKGLEYIHAGRRYVEKPYVAEAHYVDESPDLNDVYRVFTVYGTISNYGPGFIVERAANDESGHVLYRIKVWGKLILYGSIMIPDKN